MMPNKPKQRFVELSVGEVSLVDSPANEQEFVVVKRLNNQEVGDMADDTKKTVETEGVEQPVVKNDGEGAAEVVPVEVEVASNEAVEKAMAQVTELVGNIAKAVGSESEQSDDKPDDADVEKGKKPNMASMYKAQLTKAGIKGEAYTKAMAEFEKAFKPFKPGPDTQPPIKKNDDAEAVEKKEATEEHTEDDAVKKMLDALAVGVEKAKRFTPKREAALKAAIETLTGLMKELAVQEIPAGQNPKTNTPAGTSFGQSGVIALTKGMDELKEILTGKLSEVQEVAKTLSERVETIEKTRNPSSSVEGEGGTDTTEDVKKSFWAGVL